MIFFMLAPARRSFFRSFFLTLSSVVRNIIFMGSRLYPGGSSMQVMPLLNAAIRWHHNVVFPIPPSAAITDICPAGIHPGISHFASSSGKSSSDLNRENKGSTSGGGGSHCGVVLISCAIMAQAFSSPNWRSISDTSPCSGISGHTRARSNTFTLEPAP